MAVVMIRTAEVYAMFGYFGCGAGTNVTQADGLMLHFSAKMLNSGSFCEYIRISPVPGVVFESRQRENLKFLNTERHKKVRKDHGYTWIYIEKILRKNTFFFPHLFIVQQG